ncbi:50S ribosomal protein L24 [Candidatus Curtissbacteria bacterium RIFCSPLOWO2_01_FULL_39_62]|uniref:Large ribosomal subunit protein uL24 n=2 Tax=Candidatus Curtissiibacteriota TaxID=1752717 RepID=A0A1F5G7H0_9BACT|nr:MAG: 50S ribosomal protein L24 [Candidatus Curtissbacteria bacterium RIFCSPHIGHO2_01_FULL_39_57]OGD87820.1 MAG: 50S ribosomal protein L24 [Candidatus Curtissbacteria bacterium RIFCSPHIGHO2_02_FULL_40_16b]OGD90573.1 MAG: 50S ribosomal protein L24 [Candidatus Curtissbacteria bacterium RIFCSPHIGHO2_12_FULL_38_37]OGD99810.1 MAG: 50S ribosomal protein L24 [Candidatus Curtissbacteria bacterium RIFCSPLOWO2_02_FULL_40_11]OGE01083.1 MAG: 50S ribosomal protein L24 [Candidatus Curtissbacteria bacterium
MFKYKTGDEVLITAGKEKGKKSKIERVLPSENKLVITGINIYKRHKKATRNEKAGIFEVVRPVSVANVQVICPKCTKPSRVGFVTRDSIKNRVCKKCKGVLK